MTYTFEDFRRDVALEVLPTLPPEELLQKFSPEDRLKGLSPKDLLQGLSVEQLQQFKALLAEESKGDRAKKPGRKKPH